MKTLRRAVGSVVAVTVAASLVTSPPAQAAAPAPVTPTQLADFLLGAYIQITANDRDYAKTLVASAESHDWRLRFPAATTQQIADHGTKVLREIDKAVTEQVETSPDWTIAGVALGAVQTMRAKPETAPTMDNTIIDGPALDKILAALTARDEIPGSERISDRLDGSFREYTWNKAFPEKKQEVWALVAGKARTDATFRDAWNLTMGNGIGISAAATAKEIGEKPKVKQYFDYTKFEPIQTKPDLVRAEAERQLRDLIAKTKAQRTSMWGDIKVAAPGPDKTKEKIKGKQEQYQEGIDGFHNTFEGVALFVQYAGGDPKTANEIRRYANGLYQVATSVNKAIAAFQMINSIASIATVAFTGNVIGALSSFMGMFGGGDPINQQILAEIQALREEIKSLREEMRGRFDKIDSKLNSMFDSIMAEFDKIKADVVLTKDMLVAMAAKLSTVEIQILSLGANGASAEQANLMKETLELSDRWIDLKVDRPNEEVPADTYSTTLSKYRTAATQHAYQEGAFTPKNPGQTLPANMQFNLGSFGTAGSIQNLAMYAANKGWGISDTGPVANPEGWKVAATAYTLLAHQNPQLANRVEWTEAEGVLTTGQRIINAAQQFSKPGENGAVNPLFNGLMNDYLTEVTMFFNRGKTTEDSVTGNQYDLWGGSAQPVGDSEQMKDKPTTRRCGTTGEGSDFITRPSTMSTLLLSPEERFAMRHLPKKPVQVLCWTASHINPRQTSREDRCEAEGGTVPCTITDKFADLQVEFYHRLDWPLGTEPTPSSQPSRSAVTTVVPNHRYEVCYSAGVFSGCREKQPPIPTVMAGWDQTLKSKFEQAVPQVSQDRVALAKAMVDNFLRGQQSKYYSDMATDIKSANHSSAVDLQVNLLRSYTELGFPRALQSDETLRGLLQGKFALVSSVDRQRGRLDEETGSLAALYQTAAGNVVAQRPVWQNEQFEDPGQPCPRINNLTARDPFAICMAASAKHRLDQLAERYKVQFQNRFNKVDQRLPDVQEVLRNLTLVTNKLHPKSRLTPVDDSVMQIPVDADYDGDGKIDKAFFRPVDGDWTYEPTTAPATSKHVQFGQNGDLPVPADYDRDGKADPAVVRPSDRRFRTVSGQTLDWTVAGYVPASGELPGMRLLANRLSELAQTFSRLGRGTEALEAQRYAATVYTNLANAAPSDKPALGDSLVTLGSLASAAGAHDEAITAGRGGVDTFRQLNNKPKLAWALGNLGYRYSAAGKYADAPVPQREAREIYRGLGDKVNLADASVVLGSFASQAGLHDEAIAAAKEGVAGFRELNLKPKLAWALNNLAYRFSAAGKAAEAVTPQREARDIYRALDDKVNLAQASVHLGSFLQAAGLHDEAITVAKEGVDVYRQLDSKPGIGWALFNLAHRYIAVGKKPEAKTAAQESVQIYEVLAAADPANYALSLKQSKDLLASLG